MPFKPKTPCREQGCPNLVNDYRESRGRCPKHAEEFNQQYDALRPSPSKRGYDGTWSEFRKMILAERPLCEEHKKIGEIIPSLEIHHVKPITTHPELRLDPDNVVALCKPCHSAITLSRIHPGG